MNPAANTGFIFRRISKIMVLVQLVALLPACTLAISARVPVTGAATNSEHMGQRLSYSVNRTGPALANLRRVTALLPGEPYIRYVGNGGDPLGATPNKLVASAGDSVELKCEVVGMPSPTVHWVKGGRPVVASTGAEEDDALSNVMELLSNEGRPSLETAVTSATLVIRCVSPSEAGVYQCVGDNGAGKVIVETQLIVRDASEERTCQPLQPDRVAPFIYMSTDMRMEYPGNNAQLNCRATGIPKPTIRWYDVENKLVKSGPNYTLLSNGDLLVKQIDFPDDKPFRRYTCRATNTAGSNTASIGLLSVTPSDK